jgi:ElaB/YqjD/DUF883 family membrane-anchored ribosome-binding protein
MPMDAIPDLDAEDAEPADGPETWARAEGANMPSDDLEEARMKIQAAEQALNATLQWAAGKGLRLAVAVSDEYLVDHSQTAVGPCPVVAVTVGR